MKFCPTCETRYDEEILRFCTKDGTPLVDEDQPNFTELPSESSEAPAEDFGEETIISYKPSKDLLEPESPPEIERSEAPRIVISTSEQKKEQNIRARQIPPYQPVSPKQSVGKVVMLTILGTLAVLTMVLGLFVFFRSDRDPNANLSLNINTNPPPDMNLNNNLNLGGLNYNAPLPTNLNTNLTTNFNVNYTTNINANLKTPTPTPKPSPSASANINANTGNLNTNGAPPPTPRPSVSATPSPSATPKTSPTAPRVTPIPLPPGRPTNNSNAMQ